MAEWLVAIRPVGRDLVRPEWVPRSPPHGATEIRRMRLTKQNRKADHCDGCAALGTMRKLHRR
jgi:hypothetical protein